MNIKAIYLAQSLQEIEEFKNISENDITKEFSLKILDNEYILDIDIYWDALHYILVGSSLLEPDYTNPLSEMLQGTVAY